MRHGIASSSESYGLLPHVPGGVAASHQAGNASIVNVSSLAAVSGVSEAVFERTPVLPSASYIAAKAGLEGFTRYLASLGGRHNIRVNCIRPGQILTRRLTTAAGEHVFARHFEMWQLIKGPGYAEDVANAMLFFASDESRFITAEMVNHGRAARRRNCRTRPQARGKDFVRRFRRV